MLFFNLIYVRILTAIVIDNVFSCHNEASHRCQGNGVEVSLHRGS